MINYVSRYRALLLILLVSMFLMACTACRNSNTTPASPVLGGSTPILQGFHDVADCNVISGWAWNKNKPDTPVGVDIFDGDTLIATVPARTFRQDLRDIGMGNGQYGFSYAVPATLKDGRPHTINVKISGSNVLLSASSKSVTCESAK